MRLGFACINLITIITAIFSVVCSRSSIRGRNLRAPDIEDDCSQSLIAISIAFDLHENDLAIRTPVLPDAFPKDQTRKVLKLAMLRERKKQQAVARRLQVAQKKADKFAADTEKGAMKEETAPLDSPEWRREYFKGMRDRREQLKIANSARAKIQDIGKTIRDVGMTDKIMHFSMKAATKALPLTPRERVKTPENPPRKKRQKIPGGRQKAEHAISRRPNGVESGAQRRGRPRKQAA